MIDLDQQLAAYSRYLDDLGPPLVPLDSPATGDGPERTSRRRFLSMGAAAAVTIAGGTVIARIATRGDGGRSSTRASADPDWQLVSDPEGLFVPAPPTSERTSPHFVVISGIAATSHGLVAVGRERREFTTYNAMWQSDDATTWRRLPENSAFGTTEFTGASARTLVAVTELDGRIIGSDGESLWWSDDLEDWESVPIPVSGPGVGGLAATSLATGDPGVVAAGFGLWFSPDGIEWVSIDGYDYRLSTWIFGGGATYFADRFVVAATFGGPNVLTSPDGRAWSHQRLPGGDDDWPALPCGHDGTIALIGATWPERGSVPLHALAWTSADGGTTWTRTPLGDQWGDGVYPSVLVHTNGEFVAVFATVRQGEVMNVQFRSPDGMAWTEYAVDVPGARLAATAFGNGAVAVGSQGWPYFTGRTPDSTDPPDESAADLVDAASIWTLGL